MSYTQYSFRKQALCLLILGCLSFIVDGCAGSRPSTDSVLRPFFFFGAAFGAFCGTGSGSLGGVCGSGPSVDAPGPNGPLRSPGGTTGMPLVTVCPETLSWRA